MEEGKAACQGQHHKGRFGPSCTQRLLVRRKRPCNPLPCLDPPLPVCALSACPCLPAGFIVGFLAGILGVTGTGIGVKWNPADVSGSFSYGANWAWYQSNYE